MRNAMFSLITQVLPRCAAPAHIPSIRLPALNRYAHDPVGTRAWALTHLGVDAKNIILSVVHGKAPPEVGDSELRSCSQDRGLPRLFSSSFCFFIEMSMWIDWTAPTLLGAGPRGSVTPLDP